MPADRSAVTRNWGTPESPSIRGTTARVPWACWFGDTVFDLPFPATWDVQLHPPADAPDVGEEGIAQAFANPIGTSRIRDLARWKKTAGDGDYGPSPPS